MADKTSKIIQTKKKRLSKSQRTQVRRLKQAARNEGSTNSPQSNPALPVRAHKQQDQS